MECWRKSFEGGCHYCQYPYHSLASGQTTGREHSPTHQKKIESKIYWIWPSPPEQTKNQFNTQPVTPTKKLPQASYPHRSEARQNENHNHRKLIKLITWITALCSSMKLWAMQYRATQDGQVMVESSDKTWGGMANHFSILALGILWTVRKGQNVGHWKRNFPGQ